MKKNHLYLYSLIFIGILFCNCSQHLAPVGHYQDDAVSIDGNIDDWVLPLRFSNPEYTMHYSVTNDNKNIYICVLSKSQTWQRRMLKNGLSIYFDSRGEKNKNCSLIYPVKKPSEPPANNSTVPVHGSGYQETISQLLLQSDYYNTTGFLMMENGQYDLKSSQTDIRIEIKQNPDSSLVYEASVPIRYVLGKDMSSGAASKDFSVGIVLSPVTAAPANRGYSQHGNHGGNSMGGVHGGGGGRHYNPGTYTVQKAEEDWYTFRLANKKS
jgi:hypothetical protein